MAHSQLVAWRPSTARAPGLEVLAGRRLAVLDNGKPNAGLLLSTIAEHLGSRAGTVRTLTTGKETAASPAESSVIDALAAQADAVLTGSAD